SQEVGSDLRRGDIGGRSALEVSRWEQKMTDILRAIDLSKRFRKTVVLDHLNMSVPEHSVYGLVGPNGAGKTTTIKILMNARQPTEGLTEVFGHDSRKLSPEDFTQIGYVSEN